LPVLFLVDDADEMLNLRDHAANCRGILQLGDPADLVELEADQRRALRVMRRIALPVCSTLIILRPWPSS